MNMNKLLLRQLQKYHGGLENIPTEYHKFLYAISESYDHYEKDHKLLERAIDLSSNEMMGLNEELLEEGRKLEAADKELRLLFENINETFFSVDMKAYKLLQISHACEKVYGFTSDEFLSTPDLWSEVIYPDDKHISEKQAENLHAGKDVFNQYRIVHKNGSIRWIENKVIPTLDETGRLIRIDGITLDITERKKAEEKLIESEKKYKFVFENPFMGVALGTIDGYVQNANTAFCQMLGYGKNEIINMHFSAFTHPDDLEMELGLVSRLIKGEVDEYKIEKRYITKSRETIWIDLSISCVKRESERESFLIAVVQDITARKLAEEALRKSEANLRNILENTGTAFVLLDVDSNVLSYNQVAREMIFNQNGSWIEEGRNYLQFIIENKRSEVENRISALLHNGTEIKYEVEHHQENGSLKWYDVSMHPIFSGNAILGLSIASTDITDRKIKEQDIERSNERYTQVTKATRDIIWDWDFTTNKIYRSDNFKPKFGLTEDLSTAQWIEGIHPEDKERIVFSIRQKVDDPKASLWEEQYRRYTAKGEIAFILDRAYIVRDKSDNPVRMVGAMSDVTTERTLAMEREKVTADLIQRNRDLEQFSFIISHNLRLPVSNIIGLVNLITNSTKLSPADYEKCLQGLLLSSSKLDDVIKDLNHILQIRNVINEKKESVSFSELVSDIEISIQDLIQKEGAVIKTDFGQIDQFMSIKSYLYSIFFNLITNSIKYRNGEAPRIYISSQKLNNKIQLRFKDNSLGIDLSTQENKIFGLYHKFHTHKEGKGIGLYMTKTQVEILGGRITVQSAVNHGAEFLIEFEN